MAKIYTEDMFPICPITDFLCPYFNKKTWRCHMFQEENCLPYDECDAFYDESEEGEEE